MAAALADRLHSCAIHLLRRARVADRLAEVGPAQLSALSVLYFTGKLKLTRLAEIEQVSQPTMSRVVASLVAVGAVEREADADRRVHMIGITDFGRSVFEAARARRLAIIRDIVAALPAGTAKALGPALESLAQALAQG